MFKSLDFPTVMCVLSLESGAETMPELGNITWTLVITVVRLPKMLFTKTTFFHVKLYAFETSETRQNFEILR